MILAADLLVISVVGALIGCLTGLLPSLHVNTLAVLLLAAAPFLDVALRGAGLDGAPAAFQVSALVLAISVAHTFVNVVPATYLGAPDETNALSVLPGHKMLLRGIGYRCVEISALASHWSLIASVLLVLPLRWLLAEPVNLFQILKTHLFWVCLILAVLLVLGESANLGPEAWPRTVKRAAARAAALLLFLASAVYGLLLDQLPYATLIPVPPSPLLPALSGLFGAATVLTALGAPVKLPHQFLRLRGGALSLRGAGAALGSGIVAGATMSVLPGLTNASATALATTLQKGNDEETIVSLSAVNTANVIFNLAVLYLFARTRSGAVVAMQDLWPVVTWRDRLPADLAWFGFVAIASGTASLLLTLALGRLAVRRLHHVPYRPLLLATLVYMTAVVFAFTGLAGLLVHATGAALGVIPAILGLRRVALTGVLLGPVLVFLSPPGLLP